MATRRKKKIVVTSRQRKAAMVVRLAEVWHRNGKMSNDDVTDTQLFGHISFERMKTDPTPQGMYNMITFYNITLVVARCGYRDIDEDKKDSIYKELSAMLDRYRQTGKVAMSGELIRLYPHVLDVHNEQIMTAPRKVLLGAIEYHKRHGGAI